MNGTVFAYPTYLIRRKIFKLFGASFHIYGPQGELLMYSKQKAFKLREDIRLYSDETMRQELLTINARQIIDFSAAYDVVDPVVGQKVGALKRKGFKSIIRDEWILLDANDREIGLIKEDSAALALVRRFLTNLIPQKFHVEMGPALMPVATYQQNFNPFVFKLTCDFTHDPQGALDRRLGLAAGLLLSVVESRQSNAG